MMSIRQQWTDRQTEELIGRLLQVGVTLAAAVVLFGGAVYLARHGSSKPQYHVFAGQRAELRSVSGIVRQTLEFRGTAIIQLGILLLIATPVARVAFSVAAFAFERDWPYVGVTLLVLSILVYSFVSGQG